MSYSFQFERDFMDSLRCIPMAVRCKLDACGIKLKLSEWSRLTKAERETLHRLPAETPAETAAYRACLQQQVRRHTGRLPDDLPPGPPPAWADTTRLPDDLAARAGEMAVPITLAQWRGLAPLQRFALAKLSRPGHESHNLPHALREFGLMA